MKIISVKRKETNFVKACKIADTSYKAFLNYEYDNALDRIKHALKLSNYSNKDKVLKCFRLLTNELIFEKDCSSVHDHHQVIEDDTPLILIEGMGNSGSTAMWDFLMDFDNVVATSKTSTKIVREPHGLNDVLRDIESSVRFRNSLLIFFGKHVLGLSMPGEFAKKSRFYQSNSKLKTIIKVVSFRSKRQIKRLEIKSLKQAQSIMLNDSQVSVLKSFENLLVSIYSTACIQKIPVIINVFVKDYLKSFFPFYEGQYILVRNLFKMSYRDVTTLKYLSNIVYVPVIRDPRDQFVDLCLRGSKISPSNFSKQYLNSIQYLDKVINNSDSLKISILNIQFERLILSEKYRDEIIRKFNLSQNSLKQEKLFNCLSSNRNIAIYKNFDNKKAIRLIEKTLYNYLCNLNDIN